MRNHVIKTFNEYERMVEKWIDDHGEVLADNNINNIEREGFFLQGLAQNIIDQIVSHYKELSNCYAVIKDIISLSVVVIYEKESDYFDDFLHVFCETDAQNKWRIMTKYEDVRFRFRINLWGTSAKSEQSSDEIWVENQRICSAFFNYGNDPIYINVLPTIETQIFYNVCKPGDGECIRNHLIPHFKDFSKSSLFSNTRHDIVLRLNADTSIPGFNALVQEYHKLAGDMCHEYDNLPLEHSLSETGTGETMEQEDEGYAVKFRGVKCYSWGKVFLKGCLRSSTIKHSADLINQVTQWNKSSKKQKVNFGFVIPVKPTKDVFDLPFFSEILLWSYELSEYYEFIILDFSVSEQVKRQLQPYLAAIWATNIHVAYNGNLFLGDISSVGKLPPALFIPKEDYQTLRFLQLPLNEDIWNQVRDCDDSVITSTTFDPHSLPRKFWSYLRMCQKFLFDKFENNDSIEYRKLRTSVFNSEPFFNNYVKRIPFLALCVFALYDRFYRDELLRNYKTVLENATHKKQVSLAREDLIPSLQKNQARSRFDLYEQNKHELDIKNLVQSDAPIIIHKTIEAEIFEALSISEGLLQIIENAVRHANGCLFSMRIYSRAIGIHTGESLKPDHISYLDDTYLPDYFRYVKANFFLEVFISDWSDASIPQKFLSNLDNAERNSNKIQYTQVPELLENRALIDMKYFFEPSREQLKLKQKFYESPLNLVCHYGLDSFNSLLMARNGVFLVQGHKQGYDNLNRIFSKFLNEDKKIIQEMNSDVYGALRSFDKRITLNDDDLNEIIHTKQVAMQKKVEAMQKYRSLLGTFYQILLPLNHMYISSVSSGNNEIIPEEKIELLCHEKRKIRLVCVNVDSLIGELRNDQTTEMSRYSDKQQLVIDIYKTICNTIRNQSDDVESPVQHDGGDDFFPSDYCCFCFDFDSDSCNATSLINMYYEVLVKAILLYAMKAEESAKENSRSTPFFPVALINISPFHMIEATRILTVHYDKGNLDSARTHSSSENRFKKIPIYLKSTEVGKEVVFEGDNLDEVVERIVRNAMTNGTMYSELQTIIEILTKNKPDQ